MTSGCRLVPAAQKPIQLEALEGCGKSRIDCPQRL